MNTISRAKVIEACRALDIDPDTVDEVHLGPHGVSAKFYGMPPEGVKPLTMEGDSSGHVVTTAQWFIED